MSRTKERSNGTPLSATGLSFLLAPCVLDSRDCGEYVLVGIAISSMQRARWNFKLEPLQQGLVLRVISEAVEHNRESLVRESLDHITDLQIVLAIPVGRKPPRRDVMNAVKGNEGIVEGLRHFVAESKDIQDVRTAEESGADPTGVVEHEKPYKIVVARVTRLEVKRMKAQNATVGNLADEQECIGEQERGDVFGSDVAGVFRCADGRCGVRGN